VPKPKTSMGILPPSIKSFSIYKKLGNIIFLLFSNALQVLAYTKTYTYTLEHSSIYNSLD